MEVESKVLLLTFLSYSVNLKLKVNDVYNFCRRFGKINKLYIFERAFKQALIEFENIEGAKFALRRLHQYSFSDGIILACFSRLFNLNLSNKDPKSIIDNSMAYTMSGAAFQSRYMIIHGLNIPNISCMKIFRLAALYGRVQRIKILEHLQGSAVVEYQSVKDVCRSARNLHNLKITKTDRIKIQDKVKNVKIYSGNKRLPNGTLKCESFVKHPCKFSDEIYSNVRMPSRRLKIILIPNFGNRLDVKKIIYLKMKALKIEFSMEEIWTHHKNANIFVNFRKIEDSVAVLMQYNFSYINLGYYISRIVMFFD